MKRLNPATGLPFKRGDMREDGLLFNGYSTSKKRKDGTFHEIWLSPEALENTKSRSRLNSQKQRSTIEGIVEVQGWNAGYRSRKEGKPFDLTKEYLLSILPKCCPVFNVEFVWFDKKGKVHPFGAALDRIIPEKGYVKGNVQWLSNLANMMKQNATSEQLKQFAEWVLSHS